MRTNHAVKFSAIVILIAVLTYIAFAGNLFGLKIPGANDIVLGIDVNGGVDATLTGVKADGSAPTDKELESARTIISTRLDNQGITDKNITLDKTKKRILVEIPYKNDQKQADPNKVIAEAIQPAQITFWEVDVNKLDENGNPTKVGEAIVKGDEVEDAVFSNGRDGSPGVELRLNPKGTKSFADATRRLVGKTIAIYLDEKLVERATVNEPIPNGIATISGNMTAKSAGELAELIRSGALPFKLEKISVNSISPILGRNALDIMLQSGLVALILVFLFMLLYYRLPGLIACIALVAHTVLQVLFISWMHLTNLTLPGLAGIILTIGMGVDANIIIFERIKEEIRSGKTTRAAIDTGFKRAFTAVLDANVTTLITAVFLWIFGSGTIRGFAFTLGLGVILSFLTAVFISRILLQSISGLNFAKHKWLYGVSVRGITVKEKEVQNNG